MSMPASSYHRHVEKCRVLKGFCQVFETMVQHTLIVGDIVECAYEVARVVKAGDGWRCSVGDSSSGEGDSIGECSCSSIGGEGDSSGGEGGSGGGEGGSGGGEGGSSGNGDDADITVICVVEGDKQENTDDDLIMIGFVEGDKDGEENGDGDEVEFLGMVMGDSSEEENCTVL